MKKIVPISLFLFSYFFLLTHTGKAQAIQTGKSYVNITKGTNGGTMEAGDTLEIRATIAVGDWNINPITITNCRFNDTIPLNTTYITGSLKILTNEGLVWRSFTDNNDADQGRYYAPSRSVRINMGSTFNGGGGATVFLGTAPPNDANPTGTSGGRIENDGRPSFYNGICIMSASYRIRIDSPLVYGTLINMHGGTFRYTRGATANTNSLLPYTISLTENVGLCTNSIGANAIIDNGGTFGSGITQNRPLPSIVPGYNFVSTAFNQPNDGSYSIVNNMSPSGSINVNSPRPDTASVNANIARVHRLWDIMGDHTGAAVPADGNAPVAPGMNGGYFVAINASYANNNAIQQTVGGLCPNTYYEFSAWFKNICKYCACDTTGDPPYRQATPAPNMTFVPNGNFNGPDSSGVNPNLTFTIDGIDYYTSGRLAYTGDWVKKGFIYRTGPAQTSFTLTIRNNAAGGGGNDWGIDDVTLATCSPNLNLQPSPTAQTCYGDQVNMFAIVRSFFPNYANWRWERSTDGGVNWTNTGISGTGIPVLVSGEYEYVATYPTFLSDSGVHNSLYRIRIASTVANLDDPDCSFLASTTIIVMVNNCSEVLKSDILGFSGNVISNIAHLKWTVTGETGSEFYEIESSDDKINFSSIGTVQSSSANGGNNSYTFTDGRPLSGPRYYRVKAKNGPSQKYSSIILLSNSELEFAIKSLVNPFNSTIRFELISPDNGTATISLLDMYGRLVMLSKEAIVSGANTIQLKNLSTLQSGVYMLQVQHKDRKVIKRLLKIDP